MSRAPGQGRRGGQCAVFEPLGKTTIYSSKIAKVPTQMGICFTVTWLGAHCPGPAGCPCLLPRAPTQPRESRPEGQGTDTACPPCHLGALPCVGFVQVFTSEVSDLHGDHRAVLQGVPTRPAPSPQRWRPVSVARLSAPGHWMSTVGGQRVAKTPGNFGILEATTRVLCRG